MESLNNLIKQLKGFGVNTDTISDGYHTFEELYQFRLYYNAALFNEWAALKLYDVHKSYRHHDDELCFGGGWFIVVANLPSGQISNHYEDKYWDLFKIPYSINARYPYDGHTSKDVLERLELMCKVDKNGGFKHK